MALGRVSPIIFESVSNVTATNSVELGSETIYNGEVYQYIYNCGVSTASVCQGLSRPTSAAAGLYSGSVSSASGDLCLGFVKHADIPTAKYGWVIKRGICPVSCNTDQAVGALALGANGLVATHTKGYLVGDLRTAIASSVSGSALICIV